MSIQLPGEDDHYIWISSMETGPESNAARSSVIYASHRLQGMLSRLRCCIPANFGLKRAHLRANANRRKPMDTSDRSALLTLNNARNHGDFEAVVYLLLGRIHRPRTPFSQPCRRPASDWLLQAAIGRSTT